MVRLKLFTLALGLALSGALGAAGVPAPAEPGKNTNWIKVNTVGYASAWPKLAVVNKDFAAQGLALGAFEEGGGKLVWQAGPADLRDLGVDANSGDRCLQADFSALAKPGRYRLALFPKGKPQAQPGPFDASEAFEISERPYAKALLAAQKMFYYQRTRTALEAKYAAWGEGDDDYSRAGVSHAHGEVGWMEDYFPDKKRRWPLQRGWADAGNLDMYIPSTAPSCSMLLQAYELNPAAFGDANNIPESGNGVPDILDEAAWGLDWVACLQTPEGSFRAREAVLKVGEAPSGPADKDLSPRWVGKPGSASTAKACAALAQGARVYKAFDPARSRAYGAAAKKAWAWLQAHPGRLPVANPPGGNQPLWDDGAEYKSEAGARAAAAWEMWASFRDEGALKALRQLWADPQLSMDGLFGGWANVGRYAVLGAALDPSAPADLQAQARERLFKGVETMRSPSAADGYRCALTKADYYWGSPSNLMEKTALLALAARLDPQGHAWALQAARDQWHWVLGRNPNGYSLITRVGRGPARIYHSEWGKKRLPPPGFLVDGPNGSDADFLAPGRPAKALLWFSPMDLSSGVKAGDPWHNAQTDLWEGGFLPKDDWSKGWWVVTEVDIYYNAALVKAAALLDAR